MAKTWKQPMCPLMDDWIKEMCYIYTINYITDEIIAICANMNGLCVCVCVCLERKEEEKNIDVRPEHVLAAFCAHPLPPLPHTRDPVCNLGMCPD